jgi:hypothetical protein
VGTFTVCSPHPKTQEPHFWPHSPSRNALTARTRNPSLLHARALPGCRGCEKTEISYCRLGRDGQQSQSPDLVGTCGIIIESKSTRRRLPCPMSPWPYHHVPPDVFSSTVAYDHHCMCRPPTAITPIPSACQCLLFPPAFSAFFEGPTRHCYPRRICGKESIVENLLYPEKYHYLVHRIG